MSDKVSRSKPTRFLFLIFFFSFSCIIFLPTSASELCSSSFCRRTEPIIRFPFRLQNIQPNSCAYKGFDLVCGAFNRTLINLPNSGNFTVQAVDYAAQNIWLNDPDTCLPKRLLNLNLSGTPFNRAFTQYFTFFNCTLDYSKYKFNRIGCLSGENYTVLATSSERAVRFLAARCGWVATVAVPVQWGFYEPIETSDLSDDIRLSWASPRCGRCESRGGECGFRSTDSTVIECRNLGRRELPRSASYAIVLGIGVPALLCLVGLVAFICSRVLNRRRHRLIMDFSVAVGPHPTNTAAAAAAISGLDCATIESYPKTFLGESRRLPKPEDNICSICLSEYMPKETLRSIPECHHCFHAQCIDEWLRLNPSCPVCRNSPKPSPHLIIAQSS